MVGGQVKTMLRSGNDIRVKSGTGTAGSWLKADRSQFAAPAHLSVLKSAGALTLALDTGVIHAQIERKPVLTIYTAQIQAKPIAIGDGPQDALIGFETPGAMCVKANRGRGSPGAAAHGSECNRAARRRCVGEQWAVGGAAKHARALQLRGSGEKASQKRRNSAGWPRRRRSRKSRRPKEKKEVSKREDIFLEKPAKPKEEPVYQVFMPPLAYDAKAAVQKDNFDPKLILVVRRVRVRPTLIFQGRVEDGPAKPQNTAAQSVKPARAHVHPLPAQPEDSVVNRVRAFFRRLFS